MASFVVLIPLLMATSPGHLVFSAASEQQVKAVRMREFNEPAGLYTAASEPKRRLDAADINYFNYFDPGLINDAGKVGTDLGDAAAKTTCKAGDDSDGVQAQLEAIHTIETVALEAAGLGTKSTGSNGPTSGEYLNTPGRATVGDRQVGIGLGGSSGVADLGAAKGADDFSLSAGKQTQNQATRERDAAGAHSRGVPKRGGAFDGAGYLAVGEAKAPVTLVNEEKMALRERLASDADTHTSTAAEHKVMTGEAADFGGISFRAKDAADKAQINDLVDEQESLIAKASVIEATAGPTWHKSTDFEAKRNMQIDFASRSAEVEAIALTAVEAAEPADAQERFVEQERISRQGQLPHLNLHERHKFELQVRQIYRFLFLSSICIVKYLAPYPNRHDNSRSMTLI